MYQCYPAIVADPFLLIFLKSRPYNVIRKFQYFACYPLLLDHWCGFYIKNKIGPSTDPSGSPLKTGFQFKTSPSTTTVRLQLVNHRSIQVIILIPVPWDFNLSISLLCGTLSNAFWKANVDYIYW